VEKNTEFLNVKDCGTHAYSSHCKKPTVVNISLLVLLCSEKLM